jgi:hypothetical protein
MPNQLARALVDAIKNTRQCIASEQTIMKDLDRKLELMLTFANALDHVGFSDDDGLADQQARMLAKSIQDMSKTIIACSIRIEDSHKSYVVLDRCIKEMMPTINEKMK